MFLVNSFVTLMQKWPPDAAKNENFWILNWQSRPKPLQVWSKFQVVQLISPRSHIP